MNKEGNAEYKICENIHKIRISKGISLQHIAKKLGKTQEYISMIEKKKKPLNLEMLLKIANVLEVEVSELINIKENNSNKTPELNSLSSILQNMNVKELNTIKSITKRLYDLSHPQKEE